jgi:hypothetical protein
LPLTVSATTGNAAPVAESFSTTLTPDGVGKTIVAVAWVRAFCGVTA